MPGNPGAWVVVRDSPNRCEDASLTQSQKDNCAATGGAVFVVILLAFAIFVAFVMNKSH